MDVEINAGGRYVKVTGTDSPDDVLKLWEATDAPAPTFPALGFRDDKAMQHDHDRGYGTNSGHRPVVR